MKYAPYVLKHLRRNWIRTSSTVLGMAVCIFLVCVLQTVLAAINYSLDAVSDKRLWMRHGVSIIFPIPASYEARIASVPGVTRVAEATWFNGIYDEPSNFFANFAVDMDDYLAIYPEMIVPEDQRRALLADRRGALIGRKLAERFGWTIGDTFQLESTIPPYRVGRPFEFVVRAIYDADLRKNPGTDLGSMFFHYEYLYEATNRRAEPGNFVIEIDDPQQAGAISRAIDALFENSEAPTKTETEGAFVAGFVSLAGNLALLINLIGVAVAFTILAVTANTMSMAVRERRTEIAVLKTLGFPSALVLLLVLGEALAIGLLGGGLGLALAWVTVRGLTNLPFLGGVLAVYPDVGLTPWVTSLGLGTALLLALAAGLVPGVLAYRSRITEALRQV